MFGSRFGGDGGDSGGGGQGGGVVYVCRHARWAIVSNVSGMALLCTIGFSNTHGMNVVPIRSFIMCLWCRFSFEREGKTLLCCVGDYYESVGKSAGGNTWFVF